MADLPPNATVPQTATPLTAATWRGLVPYLGPKWLVKDGTVNPDGSITQTDSRILYTLAAMRDALGVDRLRMGVRARFISNAPVDALSYIGRALNTYQGPSESLVAYLARLQTAIDDARIAGSAWPLLNQVRGYCAPAAVRVRLYNVRGNCYTINRDGTRSTARATAWNWDGTSSAWSRFWVIIYPTTGAPQLPWARASVMGTAGVKVGSPSNRTVGSTATTDDVFAIRRMVSTWKPIGSRCEKIVIAFTDTDFDPAFTSPPLPNGTWANDGTYSTTAPGRLVPARNANAIYWGGSS